MPVLPYRYLCEPADHRKRLAVGIGIEVDASSRCVCAWQRAGSRGVMRDAPCTEARHCADAVRWCNTPIYDGPAVGIALRVAAAIELHDENGRVECTKANQVGCTIMVEIDKVRISLAAGIPCRHLCARRKHRAR
eukprot:6973656-Prymnesium_polylepis.3